MRDDSANPEHTSRRTFLKVGASAVAAGVAIASAVEIPALSASAHQSQITMLQAQVNQLQNQAALVAQLQNQSTGLQAQLGGLSGFLYLNTDEQVLLESAAEAIIPSDSNGPGAKETGVIYFIDRALSGTYGSSGNMYMKGPFALPNQKWPIAVNGQVYAHGTPTQRVATGTGYQYPMDLRYFWRYGTEALANYCSTAYGDAFQNLSGDKRANVLADLWNNRPASFNGIIPSDYAFELFFLVWSGFLMDPLYGGNLNMAGWQFVGFNGANTGNFYGEGQKPLALATSSAPTPLRPASLAQLQQSGKAPSK